MATPVPVQFGPPPADWDHRLIRDKATIEQLTQSWLGGKVQTLDELQKGHT